MSFSQKIYISLIIFVVLSILLIAFVIYPLFREIKESSQEFQLTKNKFYSLIREKNQRGSIEELYRNYQSDLERTEKIFIDSDAPLEFINFLEETASSSQIQLKISSATKEAAEKDLWPSLLFRISITGFFPNFLQFLERLENSPYLIKTLELNVKGLTEKEIKSEENSLAETIVNLSIKVFSK